LRTACGLRAERGRRCGDTALRCRCGADDRIGYCRRRFRCDVNGKSCSSAAGTAAAHVSVGGWEFSGMVSLRGGQRVDTRFGRYELQSLIGVGGMGEVYRAYDTVRDRIVALKLLLPELAADTRYQER